jgi:hypothetical protein
MVGIHLDNQVERLYVFYIASIAIVNSPISGGILRAHTYIHNFHVTLQPIGVFPSQLKSMAPLLFSRLLATRTCQ